jgi:cyclase
MSNPTREIAERPDGYRGPDLSPGTLQLRPVAIGDRTWALMANIPPKDNNGLIAGDEAALVVDAGITAGVSEHIQSLAAELTDRPVRYLVNTTYHGDHTFGNAAFPAEVVVVSSRLNRAAMTDLDYEKARRSGNLHGEADALDGVDVWRRPEVTFERCAEIDLGGHVVQLWHFGPGNGPGDTIVYDTATATAWTGNFLCHAGVMPMLLEGGPGPYLASLRAMQSQLPDLRSIVPGHGPLGDGHTALTWLIDYLEELDGSVADARARGRSLEETVEALSGPRRPEPSLLAALGSYDLPDPAATRAQFGSLMTDLQRLNVLATYRAAEPA